MGQIDKGWIVMAVLDCQLASICNKLQPREGEHTSERFSAWFEEGKSTFILDLGGSKTHL